MSELEKLLGDEWLLAEIKTISEIRTLNDATTELFNVLEELMIKDNSDVDYDLIYAKRTLLNLIRDITKSKITHKEGVDYKLADLAYAVRTEIASVNGLDDEEE